MKRFLAILAAVALFVIAGPVLSYGQEQDTSKPYTPPPDTTTLSVQSQDTAKPAAQVKDTAKPSYLQTGASHTTHEVAKKKEKKNLWQRIRSIGAKKRQRLKWNNEGHHEFYTKSKREQKRISRHHLNPNKITKADKKLMRKQQGKMAKASQQAKDKKDRQKEDAAKPDDSARPDENAKPKDDAEKPKDADKPKEEDKPKDSGEKPKDDTGKPKDDTEKPKLAR